MSEQAFKAGVALEAAIDCIVNGESTRFDVVVAAGHLVAARLDAKTEKRIVDTFASRDYSGTHGEHAKHAAHVVAGHLKRELRIQRGG